jgi:DNA-binding winged helix-turn-helix (wHTH) protein
VRLQIDDLVFDSSSRQLWLNEAEIHLSPKAFDLLALLLDRRPEAVSKDELHAHLWPGTFVSGSSLPSLISEIREAIADRRRSRARLLTLRQPAGLSALPRRSRCLPVRTCSVARART